MADVVALVSSEQSKLATIYFDHGKLLQCREVLESNVRFLTTEALKCPENEMQLKVLAVQNHLQLDQLNRVVDKDDADAANWFRKSLRGYQFGVDNQQRSQTPAGNPASGIVIQNESKPAVDPKP